VFATLTAVLPLMGCSAPPDVTAVEVGECLQPPPREPLPTSLVVFLPTIGRPKFLENADRLLADGTISLANRPAFELPETPTWREDPYGDPTRVYQYEPAPVIACRIRGTRDASFETRAELFAPG
jgi:hypothetical protein